MSLTVRLILSAALGLTAALPAAAQTTDGAALLSRAGLDPARFETGAGREVSVRQPWMDGANASMVKVDNYNTQRGAARLGASTDQDVAWVQVTWTAAPAAAGYLLHCQVEGEAVDFRLSRFVGGRARENRRDKPVKKDGETLLAYLDKSESGTVYIHGLNAPWAFKACAVIPVMSK